MPVFFISEKEGRRITPPSTRKATLSLPFRSAGWCYASACAAHHKASRTTPNFALAWAFIPLLGSSAAP